jgi:very-short-patch-repair endonuclease
VTVSASIATTLEAEGVGRGHTAIGYFYPNQPKCQGEAECSSALVVRRSGDRDGLSLAARCLEWCVSGRRSVWRVRLFGQETPALVGIVTRVKDWELLRSEHWYRIPVRTAPEGLDSIQYLAFYQTRLFVDEKWAVNWYAPVGAIRRVRRRELLPDEPTHPRADAEYYKVELGELMRLPRPIPSRRWRRIVFIPTSLERLLHALEINDLFKVSPIEDELYFALGDAGLPAERQFFVREGGSGYMLDLAVFCRDSNLDIECDGEAYHSGRDKAEQDRERDNTLTTAGWHILRFSGRRILRDTGHCLETVSRTVRRLGGVSGKGCLRCPRRQA